MQNYRRLQVWEKAHLIAIELHRLTDTWTGRRSFGLASQTRRAAESIPANIAEGCGRATSAELARFLQIAIGSTTELEYHLQFAGDTSIISPALSRRYQDRVVETRKMLIGLLKKVRARDME